MGKSSIVWIHSFRLRQGPACRQAGLADKMWINVVLFGSIAQLVRALCSHRRGPWFESKWIHHVNFIKLLRKKRIDMKVFILSPNFDNLFTDELLNQIKSNQIELIIEKEPKLLDQVSGLLDSSDDKVLAIDPDFCNWKFPNEFLSKINNLKAVCLQTTSFGWIDTSRCKDLSIPVTNLRGFSTKALTEYLLFMILGVARKIAIVAQDGYVENNAKHRGIEIRGKKVGIIGLGKIGLGLANILKDVGMDVHYWSRSSRNDEFTYEELDSLIKTADFIVPCCSKNEDTSKILTDERLRSMKKTASFITFARGMQYNKETIISMVQAGDLYGFGVEEENGSPIKYSGNIFAVPEIGWCTTECMERNAKQWADSIINAIKGEYPTRVN